jgi:hypothetical protein
MTTGRGLWAEPAGGYVRAVSRWDADQGGRKLPLEECWLRANTSVRAGHGIEGIVDRALD